MRLVRRVALLVVGLSLLALCGVLRGARREPSNAYWVVYTDILGRQEAIYRVWPDGSRQQRLTDSDSANEYPLWSPDGKWLAFVSNRSGQWKLYRMSGGGDHLREVAALAWTAGDTYQWSPDSRWLVVLLSPGSFRLYDAAAGGSRSTAAINEAQPPLWTPDGQWVVFTSLAENQEGIQRMHPDGSRRQRLTQNVDVVRAISPDGQWILFHSPEGPTVQIHRMRLDGSDRQALSTPPGSSRNLVVSPDGQWIAFESDRSGSSEIYRMRLDGGELLQLTHAGSAANGPSWSADGEWIAYVSDRDGAVRPYRIRPDGADEQRLDELPRYFRPPTWSPVIDLAWSPGRLLMVGGVVLALAAIGFGRRRPA
jgi:Tol biopolymer transport system component